MQKKMFGIKSKNIGILIILGKARDYLLQRA